MSLNRVALTGNLTRDSELRMTTSGSPVLNFGIAVNDRRRNQQTGEWEDRPNFIDCAFFGKRAEGLSRFLMKGTKVAVIGKLRQTTWESEDRKRHNKVEVVVEDIDLMTNRNAGSGAYQANPNPADPNQGYAMTYPQDQGYGY